MRVTRSGDVVLNEKDILSGLYSGKITSFSRLNVEDDELISTFNSAVKFNADKIDTLIKYCESNKTLQEVDKERQSRWVVSDTYKDFDIASWLISQCKNSTEENRVVKELELFLEKEMIQVLIFLKFLVDTMRENNIIWGVGRGSSVASFCLYLISVHKINPLDYDLDIKEFLKDE